MGAQHIAAMEPSLSEIYKGITAFDDPPTSCCNLAALTLLGSEVWLPVMPKRGSGSGKSISSSTCSSLGTPVTLA